MDVVERLRRWSPEESTHELLSEAADEIENLMDEISFLFQCVGEHQKEITRLQGALQKIADVGHEDIPAPKTSHEANLWGIVEGCVRVAEVSLGR